jgi:hypothetical protein
MTERTTVRLPDDLVRRAKHKAAVEGLSLTALIEEGLRRVLKEPAPGGHAGHGPLPVSPARGGLRPGVDLNDTASLQDLEDLDYIGRMR